MNEGRIRVDWKGRYEALLVEHQQVQRNLLELRNESDGYLAQIEELKVSIERLKKRVERARAEGLKGAAEFLLGAE